MTKIVPRLESLLNGEEQSPSFASYLPLRQAVGTEENRPPYDRPVFAIGSVIDIRLHLLKSRRSREVDERFTSTKIARKEAALLEIANIHHHLTPSTPSQWSQFFQKFPVSSCLPLGRPQYTKLNDTDYCRLLQGAMEI